MESVWNVAVVLPSPDALAPFPLMVALSLHDWLRGAALDACSTAGQRQAIH
ncbi:MAG: hypothetical protein IRY83_06665 [Chloroflexi bacterium]|nr:hypothetical protein [Chloroflexota bacterium]